MDQPKIRILFVCLGNICRSPTAHGVAYDLIVERGLTGQVQLDSAGTGNYHIGSPPDPRAQEAAMGRGHDLSWIRARSVEPEDFKRFDLLLAMDQSNYDDLLAMAAASKGHARVQRLRDYADGGEVPDPYFGDGDGFEGVLDIVEASCTRLFDALEANNMQVL